MTGVDAGDKVLYPRDAGYASGSAGSRCVCSSGRTSSPASTTRLGNLRVLLATAALVMWIFVWLLVAVRVLRHHDLGAGGKVLWPS